MANPFANRAPAKINLSLAVLGRRADGYHELSSLVAFAGLADGLALTPGPRLSLTLGGPNGRGLSAGVDNLVLRASRNLAERRPGLALGGFHLVKRLPVASGIGGGSADAAAALRLLAQLNRIRLDDPALFEAAHATGADVPVCLASHARMMAGVGERLGPQLRLPLLPAVLVNPGVAVPTAEVFRELGLIPGESGPGVAAEPPRPLSPAALLGWLTEHPNDLEAPAIRRAPAIGEALAALAAVPGCRLARMSGSGATCFGLFDTREAAAEATRSLRRAHRNWWVRPTILR